MSLQRVNKSATKLLVKISMKSHDWHHDKNNFQWSDRSNFLIYHPGTFAQDVTRLIRNVRGVEDESIDDIIEIHEDLCKVVFNTVSAYSVWFVVHWLTYGAGVVVAVIYISEEIKYDTTASEYIFVGMLLFCCFYLFVFPCYFAASITGSCAGE